MQGLGEFNLERVVSLRGFVLTLRDLGGMFSLDIFFGIFSDNLKKGCCIAKLSLVYSRSFAATRKKTSTFAKKLLS